MALLSQQLQRCLLTGLTQDSSFKSSSRTGVAINGKSRSQCCSAVAIDAPSSLTGVSVIRWGVDRQVDGCVSLFLFCFIDCSLSYLTSNGISLPSPLVIQKLTDS